MAPDPEYTIDDTYHSALSFMDAVIKQDEVLAEEVRTISGDDAIITGLTAISMALIGSLLERSTTDETYEEVIMKLRTLTL